jgi:hypothetical protein
LSPLQPEKLQVRYLPNVTAEGPVFPRRYTLTHSDVTGDLFLTIGTDYNREQVSGWYTRLLRDEILAEWRESTDGLSLHVYCHVGGGLVFGTAKWREAIFRSEMPLVLEAIRYGDRSFFEAYRKLDESSIFVHFKISKTRDKIEQCGTPGDYMVTT